MKKKIAFIIALAAMASTSATAFAETNTGYEATNIEVNGKYVSGGNGTTVISADIAWDDMTFTYTDSAKAWNAETHEYEEVSEGAWSADTKTITVKNHSNTGIKADLEFSSSAEGVTGEFDKTSLSLATAEGTAVSDAPTDSAEFGIGGKGISADEKLGTITVTIAENDDTDSDLDVTKVTTYNELLQALNNGEKIKLENDITMSAYFNASKEVYIDLNGHKLNGDISGFKNVPITIMNGTMTWASGPIYAAGELTLSNCVFNATDGVAVYIASGNATITNCTMNRSDNWYALYNSSGNVTLSGDIRVGGKVNNSKGTITALAGTYNFDPTDYVDTQLYDVTKSSGIWTVTRNDNTAIAPIL